MYLEERENCAKPDAIGALFTLGRTIWELWAAAIPRDCFALDRVQNKRALAIIRDCEQGNVQTIDELKEKYFGRAID
jgi:hypothetical protein